MNEGLRAKIDRKLEALSDEVGRQLLDYLEFLESKYNRSRRAVSPLKRVAENIEESLGGTSLSEAASRGAAQMVEAAGRVMSGLAAASREVADELSRTSEPAATHEAAEPEAEVEVLEEDEPDAGGATRSA